MSRNTEATDDVKTWTGGPLNYKEGFFTQLATDELAKGINEEVVRAISAKRNEPEWMLEFRLNAYRAWLEMEEPHWLKAHYDKLNYQDYSYYSAPSCGNCDDTCASEPGAVQQTGAHAFRHINKRTVRGYRRIKRGKEVVIPRHHGAEIFTHQFRVIVDRLTKGTENNSLLRQFFAISSGNRN